MFAQGPNRLNIGAYVSQMQQQQHYQSDPNQEIQNDNQGIEEQFDHFVQELKRYDEIIAKVTQNVEQVNNSQPFITDFYNTIDFGNYQDLKEGLIIENADAELGHVVQKLYETNRKIKAQISSWVLQFSKKAMLTQTLINQNELLREYIVKKNKQIVNLVETLQKGQNAEISELQQSLKQIKQENGLLLNHLKMIKEQIKTKREQEKMIHINLERIKNQKLQIERRNKKAQEQEEHYSKLVALLQDSIDQLNQRKRKLEPEKNRLLQLNKQYQEDQKQLQIKRKQTEMDKAQLTNGLKKQYQTHNHEKNQIMQQIQQKSQQVRKQIQMAQFYKNQIIRNQNKLKEYQNLIKQMQKKIQSQNQVLKKNKQDLKSIVEKQIENSSQTDIIKYQIQLIKQQLEQNKNKEKKMDQNHKAEMKKIQQQYKIKIIKFNKKLNEDQRITAKKILDQKLRYQSSQRDLEDWQNKIMDKRDQIKQLKQKMRQIKNNQIRLNQLRQKHQKKKF